MAVSYTFVVDESGHAGINKIRSSTHGGASPFMTLGGALIRERSRGEIEADLIRIAQKAGINHIHCKDIKNHFKIVYCAREISKLDVRLFGLISRKDTLGSYREKIEHSHSKYYNKCVQYLLEKLALFLQNNNIDGSLVNIVFEDFNNDFEKLKNLIRACQRKPHYEQTKLLQHLDIDRMSVKSKCDEPLLQIADVAAHALFKCVDKEPKQCEITEPRYFKELSSAFAANPKTKRIANYGLHCVHNISALRLEPEISAMFYTIEGATSWKVQ